MATIQLGPGYLFGVPPVNWWQRWLCRLGGSATFHWGMLVGPDAAGWIGTESLAGKGPSITRFAYPHARIYKIKELHVSPDDIVSLHSQYGETPYDWDVSLRVAIWYLVKHYFGKLLPLEKDRQFNCVEWVNLLAVEMNARLVPEGEYPTPKALEHSPLLEYAGEWVTEGK